IMSYPDINKLYNYREFKEIFTNENLLEEKLHMKRYQILPSRYMSSDNEAVKRFLIYHPPGSGKSYTALWILLNFINFYEKPAIILVKNKESIINFKSRIESWYSFTFNFYKPPEGITNYQQFIKKYIEFYTYFSFFKSIKNIEDIKMHENRFIIIDEIHNFRNTKENKFIYKRINKFLSSIKNARVIFMSATPIFDNYNEISSLIKLIVPTINNNTDFTPKKVEEIMKGHVSYYGLNPPDTIVNYNGKCIQGINKYKIFEIPMKGFQLQYYQNLTKNVKNLNSMEMGINLTKAAIGVIDFNNFKLNIPHDTNNEKKRYIFKNGHIIYNDIEIQKTIIKHSENLSDYCCKFYHCLDIINKANSSDGLVFIYCNLIEDIGIYYFAALLCSMGYNYVYDNKSAKRFSKKKFLDKEFDYPELKEIRRGNKKNKKWNFTFITGDKRLCPNVLERLDMFNNSNNKDGSAIKVLIGSDILSESVDILNVRQLHILTPHWNYEKINQIIGRVRRVGSHMALPPEQRNVNIYLYSAYDPTKQYSDSINYSIDYFKYIKCENKYNQSLQYYKALQNASIESLVIKNLSKDHNLKSSQYSHLY
ncbi:P-loop containing nucleoside triphosphate hydrolase protein, partial [Piromyces finnis]